MTTQRALVLAVVATVCGLMFALPGHAQGVDLRYLEYRLSALPEVTSHAVDDQGHLVHVAGRLTPSGPSPAREVVPAFLRIHSDLYPAAPGTSYVVEWTAAVEAGTEVAVRQQVDGFSSEDLIRGVVSPEGQLLLVDGVVLHGGEGSGEGFSGPALTRVSGLWGCIPRPAQLNRLFLAFLLEPTPENPDSCRDTTCG